MGAWIVSGCLATAVSATAGAGDAVPVEHAAQAAAGDAGSESSDEFDADRFVEEYNRSQAERYDVLADSPSPRQQVLVSQIYLAGEDDTPALVRPRRADVVARAVQLAPDDAFVQWMAADRGSYTSSQCGPSKWPETEVANLLRLEPDNVVAWRFALALAKAIGDEAGIDDALSRMASASRADEHTAEKLDEWTRAYTAMPGPATPWQQPDTGLSAEDRAFLAATTMISGSHSAVAASMLDICRMEVDSDRIWQRLGWCADAAQTLASKGNSLALREEGLAILEAIGTTGPAFDTLQRQYQWLAAQDANPARSFNTDAADLVLAISDWKGAASEIDAIERKLERTGEPLEPPPGWDPNAGSEQDELVEASRKAWMTYMQTLIDELGASTDPRRQALAITAAPLFPASLEFAETEATDLDAGSTERQAALQRLAAANPDDLLVHWITAATTDPGSDGDRVDSAIAHIQRLDPDNGTSWALSLAGEAEAADLILAQIAASGRFDDHNVEILRLWMDAANSQPPPDHLLDVLGQTEILAKDAPSMFAGIAAMTWSMSARINPTHAVASACADKAEAGSTLAPSCIASARLMLHSGSSIVSAMAGERLLRRLDAHDDRDASRARTIAWWSSVGGLGNSPDSQAAALVMNDMAESGSEVEALRLAAQRAGKIDPPEDWRSPTEKKKSAEKSATGKITGGH